MDKLDKEFYDKADILLGFTDNAYEYFSKGNIKQRRKILEIISEQITYKDKNFDIKLKPIFQTIVENQYNLVIAEALNDVLHEFFDKRAYSTVKICDYACGYSNYIIETLKHYEREKFEIVFIDKDMKSQFELREPIRNFQNVQTRFKRCDITTDKAYDFIGAPDIAILSGYFDTVCKDEILIEYILRNIYNSLNPEGYFIFTTQNTDINIKTVDEIFEDFSKKKTTKDEKEVTKIKYMAEIAGFRILSEKIDSENRYCVYIATKG